jgi:Zinc finger, C3HC4 type (RING finger)
MATTAEDLAAAAARQEEIAAAEGDDGDLEGMDFFKSEKQVNEEDEEEEEGGEKDRGAGETTAPSEGGKAEEGAPVEGEESGRVGGDAEEEGPSTKRTRSTFTQPKDRRVTIPIPGIRERISCLLCGGVLREAYTLRECMHSFCRACILSYIDTEEEQGRRAKCPNDACRQEIGFYPMENVAADLVLQSLVDKLVPSVVVADVDLEVDFYNKRGLEAEARQAESKRPRTVARAATDDVKVLDPEQRKLQQQNLPEVVKVLLAVHPHEQDPTLQQGLDKPFIKTQPQVSIKQLRKYVAFRLNKKEYDDIEILFGDELLGDEHTLTFVLKQHRLGSKQQLKLHYRRRARPL